ncbi:hypothetical protein [Streptomyces sp. NPDC059916]|uniref:hypothetical protein n=1 Tax=Streptomyces sp. NPDC059916 TaxID=3347001 RepID=UPI003682B8DF
MCSVLYDKIIGRSLIDAIDAIVERAGLLALAQAAQVGGAPRFIPTADGELSRDPNGAPRRIPMWGDGTVHCGSVAVSTPTIPIAVQHGGLASNKKALPLIEDFLLDHDALIRGPEQGDDGIGLIVPDFVKPDNGWECITGTDEPADIECSIAAVDGNWSSEGFSFDTVDDDRLSARINLPGTGLYRITARADYGSEATQLVFAGPDRVDDE